MLTREGLAIEAPELVTRAKRELTVAPIDRSGIVQRPKCIQVWWTAGGRVHVPRFWHPIIHTTNFGEITPIRPQFAGALKPDLDQPRAVDAVLTSLRRTGGAVLSLGTGQGKTTCACYVIATLGVKTIVLVHKDVLRTQWAERIAQFLPGTTVSFVQGGTCDLSGDVVVAMLQTLVGREYAFPGFGMVVVDESHHIAAETFSTAMRGLCCPYSLGLSATPERKDGLTRVMHWFLGPLAYAAQRAAQRHVVVHLVKYSCARYKLPPPLTRFGTVNFVEILSDMADDRARTRAIIGEILKLRQDPERIVLVLSHRRDHCTEIAAGVPGAVAFLGGKKKKTDTSDHTTAPVVCATYSLASEGYDDPRLNALVLATPCSDVTQAAGRILRGAATKDPVIIDFQDDLSVAYAQSARRKGFYRKAGFTYAEQQRKEYAPCIIID
jgi:superfamily II DNA or RNA helicase